MIERRKRKRKATLNEVSLTRSRRDLSTKPDLLSVSRVGLNFIARGSNGYTVYSSNGVDWTKKVPNPLMISDQYIVQCLRYDQPNYLDWISCHSIKEAHKQVRLCKKLPYHEQSKFRIVHRIEELVR